MMRTTFGRGPSAARTSGAAEAASNCLLVTFM
jgi:hypothetical protein